MLTNSRHLDFVDANKMQINQVLQIKNPPLHGNGMGDIVHTRSMYHNHKLIFDNFIVLHLPFHGTIRIYHLGKERSLCFKKYYQCLNALYKM